MKTTNNHNTNRHDVGAGFARPNHRPNHRPNAAKTGGRTPPLRAIFRAIAHAALWPRSAFSTFNFQLSTNYD